MVEVEVIRPFWVDGRPAQAGAVVSLDTPTAAYVVGLGRAAYVVEPVKRVVHSKRVRPPKGAA